VQRGAIYVRVDDDRGNPHFMARADDADCNLASIGYKDLLEHRLAQRYRAGEPKILQENSAIAGRWARRPRLKHLDL